MVESLNASLQHDADDMHSADVPDGDLLPAMIALVLAIAGMMCLTTPCVNAQVTPSILNSAARLKAFW